MSRSGVASCVKVWSGFLCQGGYVAEKVIYKEDFPDWRSSEDAGQPKGEHLSDERGNLLVVMVKLADVWQ